MIVSRARERDIFRSFVFRRDPESEPTFLVLMLGLRKRLGTQDCGCFCLTAAVWWKGAHREGLSVPAHAPGVYLNFRSCTGTTWL